MRQDLFIIGGGIVAIGLACWSLWGNPHHHAPRARVAQEFKLGPEVKLVTERSPHMRSER
jgi:hypothetical protein